MKPNLVGLIGSSGAGKDRFYAQVLMPMGYVRMAFADPVRVLAMLYALRGIHGLEEDTGNYLRAFAGLYQEMHRMNRSLYIRTLMQHVGTEIGRAYKEDFWVDTLAPLVEERLAMGIPVAITDVRFPNEARWVEGLGGVLVLVGLKPHDGLYGEHESERGIVKLPYHMRGDEFVQRYSVPT